MKGLRLKDLPAMQDTRIQSLGWEDLLEKGIATLYSSIIAWRIPWKGAWQVLLSMGSQSRTWLSD